jgi:hypothetical protein
MDIVVKAAQDITTILLSYEVKIGATGEPIMMFTLNKNWE